MNVHAKTIRQTALVQRPARRMRRRFTIEEVKAMETAGVLREDEQVELIDGDIISMPPKGNRHEHMRTELADSLALRGARLFKIAQEPAFHLSQYNNPEPDILVFARDQRVYEVNGPSALLVIEVAVSSLADDLQIKGPLYAAHGVREYWVVDAARLLTHVHREPGREGYASVRTVAAGERLVPLLVPEVNLALADLGLEPLVDDESDDGSA